MKYSTLEPSAMPFSAACENNKQPIAAVLQQYVSQPGALLEIGSGTGQHAVFFSQAFPQVHWQPTDRDVHSSGLSQRVRLPNLTNLAAPQVLAIDAMPQDQAAHLPPALPEWLAESYPQGFEYVFTANTLHIMPWPNVIALFALLPQLLKPAAKVCVYGPFKQAGQHTSASNARFDQHLKAQAAHQGVRDLEAICALADQAQLQWLQSHAMPANNQLLVWTCCKAA